MVLTGHYRIVPLPGADTATFETAARSFQLQPTRVTRHLSTSLMKSSGSPVTSYILIANVDSMNDSYEFPSASALQEELKAVGVVTGLEVFTADA